MRVTQQTGLQASFDAFVREHGPNLGRLAYVLTGGDQGASEDMLQEALLRVWSRWSKLESTTNVRAYTRKVMVNLQIDSARSNRRRLLSPAALLAANEVDHDADDVDADLIWHTLKRLPPKLQAAIVLRYYEDLPDDEIARILGIRQASVRSRVSRGLSQLRAFIQQSENGAADE
jgi:RNA polymerase sigma-70 factor (sigma-E family)